MKRFWLYFALALGIGGFFLWLAARDLPWSEAGAWAAGEDLAHLAQWTVVFVVGYAMCHGARIVRWYFLVKPLGEVEPARVHRVCAVGLTAILLLPLRLGELVRPYLLAKRTDLPMSAVLGTAVVERVIDGLIVTGLLFVTLASYDGGQSQEFATVTGLISAGIFIPALLVSIAALFQKERVIGLVRRIGNLVSESLTAKVTHLLEAFIDGFRALARGHALLPFLAITAFYWGMNILSMWLLGHYGFGLELGLWDMATVLAVLVIGIMIPAGPGGAGNFQYFLLRGLGLFVALEGVTAVSAGAFAATLHVLQFFVILVPGLVVMSIDPESRHLVRLSSEADAAI